MLPQSRVIFARNSTLTDYSRELSDLEEGGVALSIAHATDALYIGSDMPFNHRHLQLALANKNTVAGSISVEIWDGSAWRAAVNVLDLTSVSGVPFSRAGTILWTASRSYEWARQCSTEDMGASEPLSAIKIYDKFWARLKFSADFAFTLDYVGHKFSKDSDLRTYYSDLDRDEVREAFFGEPTENFDALHIAAAGELIRDLRARQVIWSGNQILEPDQFRDAGSHKVAEIVYSPGGLNRPEHRDAAVEKYAESMDKLNFKVDKAGTGKIEPWQAIPVSRVRRR